MNNKTAGINQTKRNYDSFSADIAPVPYSKRNISSKAMITMWFSMAVQMGIFMSAGQMFPSLSVGQIFLALLIGNTIPAVVILFTQDMGIRYGIPFSVATRAAFGIKGAILPMALRAAPAIFWYGFQTWLGAAALNEIVNQIFGWSNLMLIVWIFGIFQIITTFYGTRFIKYMNAIAAPIMLAMGIWIIYVLLNGTDTSLGEVMKMGGDKSGIGFSAAVMAFAGGLATVAASIQDIVRDCNTDKERSKTWFGQNFSFFTSQWIGMVPASCLFGGIGAICMALSGECNPIIAISKVIGDVSPVMNILCQLFILLATWTTNAAQNLINPAYVLCTIFPKKMNYKAAVVIAGLTGLIIQPWELADSLTSVLNIIGAMVGPVIGIMVCDYLILRKRSFSLGDLYDSKGIYSYSGGVNWAAMITFIISGGAALFVPDFMFLTSCVLSFVVYYIFAKIWVIQKYPESFQNTAYEVYEAENDYFLMKKD